MLGRVLAAGGFLDPKSLIDDVGLLGVFAVVFAESGMLVGYFLGQVDVIEENLELAILTVVAISLLPIARELWRSRKERQAGRMDPEPEVNRTGAPRGASR